jgi:uncharacterized protein with ParB-like and HNH nuclease domain
MNNPSTLKQLFEDNKANKIVLPDFQRPLEWKADKQKRLLASCLVDLSIGSLLFLAGSKSDFPARKIGISIGKRYLTGYSRNFAVVGFYN